MPIHHVSPLIVIGIPALGALLALVCLLFALRAARRQRLVENLPTCTTTGVFIGLVELKGTAEAEQPTISYLAEQRCVHYAWSVSEHWSRTVRETYTDSRGKRRTRTRRESGWKTVADGGEQIPFYLRDDQGVILIHPHRATVEPAQILDLQCRPSDPLYYEKGPQYAVSNSDHRRRFTEEAVLLHAPVYVMGRAREREDVVAPEVAYDPDTPLFLISTRTEGEIRAGFGWRFRGLGFLGLVCSVAAWPVRDLILEHEPAAHLPAYIAVATAYLLVWLLGWLWMAYNSMVDLRQRVRQAWSNVDVQLKRRADLIPNLVQAVEGLHDHERLVQTELARLRGQLQPTAPGQHGPDPQGCAPAISVIVERYPDLCADQVFAKLRQNLIDTEQRIALARGYFNDIASFYNTRVKIVPDRYVAALGGMKPQPLITATDFEHSPLRVNLAS